MIKSMTGFGRGDAAEGTLQYEVELRGVNHRFLEVRLRMPPEINSLEPEARRRVAESVKRGRLDVSISRSVLEETGATVIVNRKVIENYLKAIESLKSDFQIPGSLGVESILSLPGAVRLEYRREQGTEADRDLLLRALNDALDRYEKTRLEEGTRLAADMRARLETVAEELGTIESEAAGVPLEYAKKVRKRLESLLEGQPLDETRLAQEVAYLADRSDVTEEIVRLHAHLEAARTRLSSPDGPVGKALDHLVQEMHREASTIASKASSLGITRAVLRVKAEVEKLREQTQNIE